MTAQSLTEDMVKRLSRGVMAVINKGLFTNQELMASYRDCRYLATGTLAARRSASPAGLWFISRRIMPKKSPAPKWQHYIGVNERYLTRCFHAETGCTPVEYLTSLTASNAPGRCSMKVKASPKRRWLSVLIQVHISAACFLKSSGGKSPGSMPRETSLVNNAGCEVPKSQVTAPFKHELLPLVDDTLGEGWFNL